MPIQLIPDGTIDQNGNVMTGTQDPTNANINMVVNALLSRSGLAARFFDGRRNINKEAGYPETIRPKDYQDMFDRFSLAERVVTFEPSESWKARFEVYEDDDETNETEFEKAIHELDKNLSTGFENWHDDPDMVGSNIWYYLKKLDILSGIGAYGVLLFGLNDNADYSQPVRGMEEINSTPSDMFPDRYNDKEKKDKKTGDVKFASSTHSFLNNASRREARNKVIDKLVNNYQRDGSGVYSLTYNKEQLKKDSTGNKTQLLYLRAYPEYLAQVVRWESNPTSKRYGMPVMYLLTLNDPSQVNAYSGVGMDKSSMYVHWSRLLHVADAKTSSNESLATPRMQSVFNDLYDALKIRAASSEGYWKAAYNILSVETHPAMGGDVDINKTEVRQTLFNLENSLQRTAILNGLTLKTVAPTLIDPTPYMDLVVKLICINKGWPKRIFEGSERGELASSQDEQAHIDRMDERNVLYVTPRLISSFFNACIMFGLLPEPQSGNFYVDVESLKRENPTQRAQRFLTKVQAYGAATAGNITSLFSEKDILTKLDDFTNEEADSILEASAARLEEQQQAEMEAQAAQTQAMADAGYIPEEDVEAGLTPEEIQKGQAIDQAANPTEEN